MLYQYTLGENPEIFSHALLPDDKHCSYVYGVVVPYSSNLRESMGTPRDVERLSFYSSFALNAAVEMYNHNVFQKFVLFSDATFGEERKSTGRLMKEALLRVHTIRRIQESDIVLFEANHLNNTPAQIKELAKYLSKNTLPSEQFLIIDWGFHDERVLKYLQGFGIKADTITVERTHKYYNARFQLDKLQQALPRAFEERERTLCTLARFDKRGLIPRFLKLITGPVVTDIRKIQDFGETIPNTGRRSLIFENLSGKEKLRRLQGRKYC